MTYKDFLNKNVMVAQTKGKEKEAIKMLILETLNLSPTEFYLALEKEIENPEPLQALVDKYLYENIPVQYIIGYTFFYGLKFKVNNNVLIPRFDTEILVKEVLDYVGNNKYKIVDIGTGSGCIAITLKKYLKNCEIKAIDISKEALEVAKENAVLNSVEVDFFENDLLEGVNETYDIIVSNPPYISKSDCVDKLVVDNEPHLALFAENDGMYYYEKILEMSKKNLSSSGSIFFEIGYNQREKIMPIIKKHFPLSKVKIVKDLNKNDRVVIIYNDF